MALRFVDTYGYQTKLVYTDEAFVIYGNPTNWNYYFDKPATPATAAGIEIKQYTRKAHTRRSYPGDPTPVNVSQAACEWVFDPGRKVGNAVPGYSIVLDDGTEKRQFTFDGDVAELILFCKEHLKAATAVYTQGARYTVTPGEVEGGGDA
jgi:nucleoside-diphosphate-sugar epimerase